MRASRGSHNLSLRRAVPAPPAEAVASRLEAFLLAAEQPAILHPGDTPIPLRAECYAITVQPGAVRIEAWDESRTLTRKVVAVEAESRGRLILRFEQFGGGTGLLEIVDLAAPRAAPALLSARRHLLRERLRRWLGRQFPGWRIEELTDGADLENSLSPVFSRALVRRGAVRWAILAASSDRAHAGRALTFGLIWLDYLRRRESAPIEGLALFLPLRYLAATRLRARHLNIRIELFGYDEDGHEAPIDAADDGNLIQALPPAPQPGAEPFLDDWAKRLLLRGDVTAEARDGGISLLLHGLPFARWQDGRWLAGVDAPRRATSEQDLLEAAEQLARLRTPGGVDRNHPWFRRKAEAWLEQVVRRDPAAIDAGLRPSPVYGQLSEWAACDRGVMDLVAADHSGRLAVLELKVSEDAHLPVQALDYWIQVRHHARTGEFTRAGYFPGVALRPEPPRLLLVAPSLSFHPTTEAVLGFFSSEVEVIRVGLAVEWQSELRVAMRAHGAQRPDRRFP